MTRKDYHKGTIQLSVGKSFDREHARKLSEATGYAGGPGTHPLSPGNFSAFVRDIGQLPVEAGPELKRLIQRYCPHKNVNELGQQDGYPSGDIATVQCKDCRFIWKVELPQ